MSDFLKLEMLDSYLAELESRVSGIRDGCEKKIVWYGDQRRQRDRAIVYIHAFSASRMETWPLCDRLAEAIATMMQLVRLSWWIDLYPHGDENAAL